MSQQYCFLCASDGGVFLDITEDNKQVYYDQFEICSLVKVPKANELPTRICHKCAYELNQCSAFIKKFKRNTKQKSNVRKQCCNLCREPAKNEFIFDLVKEKSLQQSIFFKIQKLFNHELEKFWEEFKFICLSCRYTIDVLLDLQHICEETANSIKFNNTNNKEANNLIFHKVKTTVISRKTTITESKRVNLSILRETEIDSDNMTRTRSQNQLNKKTTPKSCNKCHDSIKTDDDMYKIHETGNTVCKNCWKNMNTHKNEIEKQKQQNLTEIKLCTVFLKDVLKDSDIKAKKLYRINEDDKESDNKEDIFETQTYVCDECGASYENKVIGLTHKLTHYKQLRLKIQKLSDESFIKEIPNSNEAIDDLEDLSESIVISVEDDEEELIEDEKNLNVNNHTNVFSPKKEVIEDVVDVKLVMKEFDDDQIQKIENEKEIEIKTNVDISSIQNENEIEKDIIIETENNCTDNDKTDKSICEFDENMRSEEIQKNSDEIYNNNEDIQEKYKEKKQVKDNQENSETKMEERKKNDDITEREKEREKEKENNDIKEREEKNDIEDRENVKKNINNKDNEKEKEQEEMICNEEEKEQEQMMHTEKEKEQEEMKYNEEEIKTNKETKSNEDFVEFTMNENETQTPFKVIEQNGIEKNEVNDRNDSIQNTKQKLFECIRERKSDESEIYTKIDNFNSKESKLETNMLLEEENMINKNRSSYK
ncbi:malaria antigen isoform X2 [Apis mellifera carnica]|nr:malaria antigen isoform X2 [Apis mellifera carnica]